MHSNNQIRRAVQQALLVSAVATAAATQPAFAQETSQGLESIVVTGSRIKSANLEGTSPVTTVSSQDIAQQGVTRVEDLITQLPQAFASQNATVSNGATGAATVDLRGLGDSRTLVLVNGRRMPYGSTTSSAADLNMIPAAMVERVEILTGGASAVYGSDAIAGVVNFIMKKDFEGVQLDAQWGTYQHHNSFGGPGSPQLRDVISALHEQNPSSYSLPDSNVTDGESKEINFLMGVSTDDGRGNVTVYGGVRDNKKVLQADRDYSACSLNANPTTAFSCGGSATSYPGYFYHNAAAYTVTADHEFRPFNFYTDLYNYGPANYYQRPDTRYTLGAMGHYELAEFADVYTELMFTDYSSVAQIAPGGNFFDSNYVNCDNPLLSAQQAATVGCTPEMIASGATTNLYIARRNVEGGGRQDSFSNQSFRGVFGLRGSITKDWDYDVFAQYSKGKADTQTLNYFKKDRIQRSLDVVLADDGITPVCRSVVDGTDPACVPWNIFELGGVTPEALNYLQAPATETTTIEQELYSGSITGDLGGIGLQSPFAAESIKVALGIESRTERMKSTPDFLSINDELSGTGGPTLPLAGSTKVLDIFTELRVPIVQDAPFADQLSFDAAYRYSDYDYGTAKPTTDTYKFGLDWAPVADVKLRGSYQRAVRAPNVIELFTGQGFNLFDLPGDPCGLAATLGQVPAATQQWCLDHGVPLANYGTKGLDSPAGQYNFLQGGAPDLQPEKSDTYTFGVILQPRFLPKLAMSVDYFDIKVEDALQTFGADNTLALCYIQQNEEACGRVHRDQAGNLWRGDGYVEDLNTNIGSLQTKGIDVNLNYAGWDIGAHSLNFNLTGTYLDELVTVNVPGVTDPYDCAGKYSNACEVPKPRWRHHARVGWVTPWKMDFSLTWRYYSSVTQFRGESSEIDYKLDAQSYFDLTANWNITDKTSVLLGINNVLDEDPPATSAVGTTGNGNTFPQIYDALGRFLFLRAQVGF